VRFRHYTSDRVSTNLERMSNNDALPLVEHRPTGVATAIRVEQLTCRYGAFTAVDGVDLDVPEGELFALLGTNGAGKTTTIEALHGARRPDEGRVSVLGLDPFRQRRRLAAEVAVIGQESGFADDLTVLETLRLWNDLHGRRGEPGAILERVALAHRASARVGALSGGERRRLDLASALAVKPRVLFADEPTTGLDPTSRRAAWELLRELADGGTTVVLTTHYLDEATELAERIAIMNGGRIVRFGTVDEVTASHDAFITARLPEHLGAFDLPRLDGRVAFRGDVLEVRTPALQSDLHRLLTWADYQGIALAGLKAAPATLDEVFAELETDAGQEH
jgi:ABC-2 type transport system ATP-binding protein